WHGANWTYILWGAFHGALLCMYRAISRPSEARDMRAESAAGRGQDARATFGLAFFLRVAFFFQLTCFGWLLFAAKSVGQVGTMLRILATRHNLSFLQQNRVELAELVVCALLLICTHLIQYRRDDEDAVIFRVPVPARAVLY